MAQDIKEFLGLAGYQVTEVIDQGDEPVIFHVLPPEDDGCPRCGVITARVHQRSQKPSRILWGFFGNRQLFLELRRQRLFCSECRLPFTQRLPGLGRRQRVGRQAQVSLLQSLAEQSFSWVKRNLQVGYWRMRRILERLPLPWVDLRQLAGAEGDIYLGVDEHSFRGNDLVITITCLGPQKRLLAILDDDRGLTLREFFRELPPDLKERISAVCIDLKESYRAIIHKELPQAEVVADHFHVIADANRRLDETRRLEQAEQKTAIKRWPLVKRPERLSARQRDQLAEILRTFPTVSEHYGLKEQLRALYTCRSYAEAISRWTSLLVAMEASDDAEVVRWARTLQTWRREILAYFRRRITNGFTEGCHTKIKLLKRVSYGYRNRTVYRAKMLLGFLPRSFSALAPHLPA